MTGTTFLKLAACRVDYLILVIAGDLAASYVALLIAYILRVQLLGIWLSISFSQTLGDLVLHLWIPAVVVGIFAYAGLSDRREPFWEETQNVIKSLFLAYLIIFSIVSLGKLSSDISRAVVVETGLISLGLLPLFRFWLKPFLHKRGIGVKTPP